VLLVAAILAAVFWLPSPWGLAAVAGAAVVEVAEVGFWIWLSKRRAVATGAEALPGSRGVVVAGGQVRVAGELWRADSPDDLAPGDEVVVERLDPDLVLIVRKPTP
jgi:membrane protein implicated in regulation of membrane protease activity